jgi:hypothetical protein
MRVKPTGGRETSGTPRTYDADERRSTEEAYRKNDGDAHADPVARYAM